MLSFFAVIINNKQYNKCIFEHITVVLCMIASMQVQYTDIKAVTDANFKVLCDTRYGAYIVGCMRDIVSGARKVCARLKGGKRKRLEAAGEHLLRLSGGVVSRKLREEVEKVWSAGGPLVDEEQKVELNNKICLGALYSFCVMLQLMELEHDKF